MALSNQSLFLYGLEVTASNRSIDFRKVNAGAILTATLTAGFYSLTSLMIEVARALKAADTVNTYVVTADRTINSGKQNRITIATSGSFLSLLFSSGPSTATNAATLLGFAVADKTGALTYTGTATCGIALVPDFKGYNYLSPDFQHKVFGSLNVSANGTKEAVVYQIQQFWQVQFKYELQAKVIVEWKPFWDWCIQQKLMEFTPEISSPSVFYEGTLEKTSYDSKGLGYKMTEQLPNYPFYYDTGLLTFRQKA
jgi:hypothetical protein